LHPDIFERTGTIGGVNNPAFLLKRKIFIYAKQSEPLVFIEIKKISPA